MVDLATCIDRIELEAAVNEADKLDLITPEQLRVALDEIDRRPGVKPLGDLLDRRTFTLTDSELERMFLRVVRRARLPPPDTQVWLNGYRVDFSGRISAWSSKLTASNTTARLQSRPRIVAATTPMQPRA